MGYLVAGFLAVCTVQDLRNKAISRCVLWIGGGVIAVAVVIQLLGSFWFNGTTEVLATPLISKLCGVLVGIGMLGLSICLSGKLGKGDGIVMSIIGLGLGFGQTLSTLCLALLFAGLTAAVLLVFHKIKKDGSIPLIPFVLCGLLVTLVG